MKTSFLFYILLFTAAITAFSFKQKKQPPIAMLDHPSAKSDQLTIMKATDFKKSKGVTIQTDKAYAVTSFSMVRVPKGGDPIELSNWSGPFSQRTFKLIELARSGDTYYVENIMAKLPTMLSEAEWIELNSFVVKIE